jgi:hypothetical protein
MSSKKYNSWELRTKEKGNKFKYLEMFVVMYEMHTFLSLEAEEEVLVGVTIAVSTTLVRSGPCSE